MGQVRAARALQLVAAAGAVLGYLAHGLAGFLLGAAAFWFFGLAKPPPDASLDRATGRRDDD